MTTISYDETEEEEYLIYEGIAQMKLLQMPIFNLFDDDLDGMFGVEAAKRCFQEVLKINPKNIEALNLSGQIAVRQDDLDEAKIYFDKAIKFASTEDKIALLDVIIDDCLNCRKYECAIHYCRRALRLEKKADFYNSIGYCFDGIGEYKKGQSYYKKAIKLDPEDPYSYNDLGYSYLQDYEIEKAITILEKALEIDPDYTLAKGNLKLANEYLNDEDAYNDFIEEQMFNQAII